MILVAVMSHPYDGQVLSHQVCTSGMHVKYAIIVGKFLHALYNLTLVNVKTTYNYDCAVLQRGWKKSRVAEWRHNEVLISNVLIHHFVGQETSWLTKFQSYRRAKTN